MQMLIKGRYKGIRKRCNEDKSCLSVLYNRPEFPVKGFDTLKIKLEISGFFFFQMKREAWFFNFFYAEFLSSIDV